MKPFADTSHYQASVDLAAYKAAGHDRIVFKATEGATGTDPVFADRWRLAGQLGLARGAYHFGRSGDGAVEWRHFSGVVKAAGLTAADLLILDSEDPGNERYARTHAAAFCHAATADGHPVGAVYSGAWYATPARLTPDVLPAGWRQLWISDYSGTTDNVIGLPAGWARAQVIARQYTDRATLPGIGACDASRVIRDWLQPGALTLNADLTAAFAAVNGNLATLTRGDTGHPDNLRNLRAELGALAGKVDALTVKTAALVGAAGVLDSGAVAGRLAANLAARLRS